MVEPFLQQLFNFFILGQQSVSLTRKKKSFPSIVKMKSFEFTVDSILSVLAPAQWCQAYFVLASVCIVSIQVLPADLRESLLNYGARQQNPARRCKIAKLVDGLQVPHSWFIHFYLLSFGLSLFWAWQYYTKGEVLATLAQAQVDEVGGSVSMDISQVFVVWGLMAAQGGRRLYECLFVVKAGKSPMSVLHWLVALVFYALMSVSVWVEGSGEFTMPWISLVNSCLIVRLLSI